MSCCRRSAACMAEITAAKKTLVEYGFRLPSAFDNRPLRFEEFEKKVHQKIFVSATPGEYEREHSSRVAEQVIRPTGLLDPLIMVRPVEGQIEDLLGEIRQRIDRGERALVTTLTVKMAEDLTDYLEEHGVKTKYMHHEVDTFERMEIIKDLRLGAIDVIVGINLLREGLDLPEVFPDCDFGCRQGRFPAQRDQPDPDHRPCCAQCKRRGAYVCR